MAKFLFLDTETGGTDPSYSLLTWYGAITDDKFNIIDELSLKIRPADNNFKVTAKAMEVNMIDLEKHKLEAIPYEQATELLVEFIKKHGSEEKIKPIGHNPEFDKRFTFQYLISESEFKKYCRSIWRDTIQLATFMEDMDILPNTEKLGLSLGRIAQYYGVEPVGDLHSEIVDVKTNILFYKEMLKDIKAKRKLITEI